MVTQSKIWAILLCRIWATLPKSCEFAVSRPKRKEPKKGTEDLQEKCRRARGEKKLTAQDIADASGIPLSTVNNFFSNASKLPSIGTAGPICRVLGVSIDSCWGISPSEQGLQAEADALRSQLHELELESVRLTERVSLMERTISGNRVSSLILLVLNTVLTAALLVYLVIDANIRTEGLILHGQPTAIAYILMALAALSVAAIIIIAARTIKRRK